MEMDRRIRLRSSRRSGARRHRRARSEGRVDAPLLVPYRRPVEEIWVARDPQRDDVRLTHLVGSPQLARRGQLDRSPESCGSASPCCGARASPGLEQALGCHARGADRGVLAHVPPWANGSRVVAAITSSSRRGGISPSGIERKLLAAVAADGDHTDALRVHQPHPGDGGLAGRVVTEVSHHDVGAGPTHDLGEVGGRVELRGDLDARIGRQRTPNDLS